MLARQGKLWPLEPAHTLVVDQVPRVNGLARASITPDHQDHILQGHGRGVDPEGRFPVAAVAAVGGALVTPMLRAIGGVTQHHALVSAAALQGYEVIDRPGRLLGASITPAEV